ncbi:MAG: NAD-dependent epimerase/dehydratase family protein [Burkholderiales bacterium]|nr:NAD-dependent epimerase/dehydratase family protein [Anaerolineae bacterium]
MTGGSGFLGHHLVPMLCRAGHSVRVLTRHPEANTWLRRFPHVEVIRGDVRDQQALTSAMQGCKYLIHAGGMFRFWGSAEEFQATNTQGAESVFAAALVAGVERIVHVSTIAVIGQPKPDELIDECTPAKPADPYQQSKLNAEAVAMRYQSDHGLPIVILRPGAYYGPFGEYAFNRLFFKDPMRGIIMQVDGGRNMIFPVYIGDAAQAALLALEHGHAGEVYNVCGESISHKEAFDIICEEAHLRWPRMPIPGWLGIATARAMTALSNVTRREPFWPINLRSYVYNSWRVSSEKARRELSFAPIDFREGARRTIAWYRAGRPQVWPEADCSDTEA